MMIIWRVRRPSRYSLHDLSTKAYTNGLLKRLKKDNLPKEVLIFNIYLDFIIMFLDKFRHLIIFATGHTATYK